MKMILDADLKNMLAEAYDKGQEHQRTLTNCLDGCDQKRVKPLIDEAADLREQTIQEVFDKA